MANQFGIRYLVELMKHADPTRMFMEGRVMNHIHINCPPTDELFIRIQPCFDNKCKGKTPHVIALYGWYPPMRCCLRCGRESHIDEDGTKHVPFSPGRGVATMQREKNKKRWRKKWKDDNK